MATSPVGETEPLVWQGTPAVRAQLPTYAALALGVVAATAGLLFLGRAGDAAGDAGVGGRSLGPLVPWLLALLWLGAGVVALSVYLQSRSTRYTLTSERLRVITGLLSTTTQELELRRVRDTVVVQPFFQRLLGLGHVTLISADASTPRVTLRSVADPAALQSTIRSYVQQAYARGGVREIDVL